MNFDITHNFNSIYGTIMIQGIKRTAFAKAMGYGSTSQLSSTLEGEALISTKATIELIKNFNVNPTYLFTGQGSMFLAEKEEIDELKAHITQLEQDKNEIIKKSLELAERVKFLKREMAILLI